MQAGQLPGRSGRLSRRFFAPGSRPGRESGENRWFYTVNFTILPCFDPFSAKSGRISPKLGPMSAQECKSARWTLERDRPGRFFSSRCRKLIKSHRFQFYQKSDLPEAVKCPRGDFEMTFNGKIS